VAGSLVLHVMMYAVFKSVMGESHQNNYDSFCLRLCLGSASTGMRNDNA
jgi:hypothetical protein